MGNPQNLVQQGIEPLQTGQQLVDFEVFAMDPDPSDNGQPLKGSESDAITLYRLFANRSDIRWGRCSGLWVDTRKSMQWGWKATIDKKAAAAGVRRFLFVNGQDETGISNVKTGKVDTTYVEITDADFQVKWDEKRGRFNYNHVNDRHEPLTLANAWAFQRTIKTHYNNRDTHGTSEQFPDRICWFDGPDSDDEFDRTFEKNRTTFYTWAADDGDPEANPPKEKRLGKLVFWRWTIVNVR